MAEKDDIASRPRPLSLFRLVIDQARVTEDVINHPYQGDGTKEDPYIVTYIPHDAGNPFTWTTGRRWIIAMIVAVETLATAFASSAFSGTIRELIADLGASTELITAGISLFVLGFAVGPLIWAPLSEIYGRQIIFVITFGAFTAFNAGCIGAQNIGTLLVLRFFAGSFGSSPFTNAGGVIADIFPANERGLAMGIFALAPSMGPTFGPFIAGFMSENVGWRWVMGMLTMFSGVLWIAGTALVPETYAPVLLRRRVAALKKKTGKEYILQSDKEKGAPSVKSVLLTALVRPWILLFLEPIVFLLSLYIAIVYGTLYMLFGAYPIVFQQVRGWGEGVGGLPFLGVAVGMIIGIVFASWMGNRWYARAAERNGGIAPPEARLPPMFFGSIALPIGMFWFAWTNYPSIHWISPVMAGAPFGFGLNILFLGITNYLIDSYTVFAASVLAANTVLRSLFGAAFPLFTSDMYRALGIHWASSIPAFLALACVPFPFVFYKYGAAIRAKCIYAAQAEAIMNQLRAKAATVPATAAEPEMESSDGSSRAISRTTTTRSEKSTRFEALRTTKSRPESISEAAKYDASPYDIDRVHTSTSLAGLDLSRTRTNASVGR
jgi:multidrug resistance protein